jgi:hypothetical protein
LDLQVDDDADLDMNFKDDMEKGGARFLRCSTRARRGGEPDKTGSDDVR